MVGRVIRDYMEGGARRLTIPSFGTFMRKESGEVIFVDLLRDDDDGVLTELVEDFGHYSGVEAMALIDRFIFEARNDIERHGSTTIEGFGTMTLDHRGLYRFDYSPAPRRKKPVRETAVQERLFADEPDELKPERPASQKTQNAPKPDAAKRHPRLDIILIVAIAAAILALAVIVLSGPNGDMPFLNDR